MVYWTLKKKKIDINRREEQVKVTQIHQIKQIVLGVGVGFWIGEFKIPRDIILRICERQGNMTKDSRLARMVEMINEKQLFD